MRQVEREPDVAIVGAGVVGLSIAHALLDAGLSVVVVDRGEPGQGASFGNAGAFAFSDVLPLASPGMMRKAPRWLLDPLGPLTIRPAYAARIAPWLFRFWRASSAGAFQHSMLAQVALMRLARLETSGLIESAGLSDMLRSDGALELYESAGELAASLPGWEARAREGIQFRHIEGRDAITELQPGLATRFTHATFVPGWQSIAEPYDYVRALAARVSARGGRIRRAAVDRLVPDETGVALHFSDGETLRAGHGVVAGGAWSKPLAAGLGDRVPLDTERGYNTTLPLGAFDVKRQLTFGGHGFVVTRLADGIRVGGAVELGGLDLPPNFKRSEAMLAKAKAFLPGLDTSGGRPWMGFRPSMPDSLPVIGRASTSPRVVYAFGHGHLGLTQSAATARLVTDLITGQSPAIDLAPFRPDRF